MGRRRLTQHRTNLAQAIGRERERGMEATLDALDEIVRCSVDGCGNTALVGETVDHRGFVLWTYICGQHLKERCDVGL
jgi:hypothetical protein